MEESTTNQTPVSPVDNKGGSHMLTNLIIVLALVAIAALAWWTVSNNSTSNIESTTKQSIPEVNSSSDLTAAEAFLTDSEIDSQLNTSEIDSVLN